MTRILANEVRRVTQRKKAEKKIKLIGDDTYNTQIIMNTTET